MVATLQPELGKRLAVERARHGLTQEQVASLVGVQVLAVKRWEGGRDAPSSRRLLRLAAVLGVSVEALTSQEPPDAA